MLFFYSSLPFSFLNIFHSIQHSFYYLTMQQTEQSDNNHQPPPSQSSAPLSLYISSSSSENKSDPNHHSFQLLPTPISPTSTSNTHDFGSLFSQFSLKSNNLVETNTKSFICTDCGQTFNRAHNLKSHKTTHSASKPFQVR